MNASYLSGATLGGLPSDVAKPRYDRAKVVTGVVHLGPGAFHRAHQAPVFERLLERDPRWGITGISLHSPDVRDALQPQNGLYTLALLDDETSFQVVGAIREILVAPEDPAAVLRRLTAADTKIVTLTITEKGYCLDPAGALDVSHPDIKADIATPRHPCSAIGYLAEALDRRYAARLAPFAMIPCDNLSGNGRKLAMGVTTLARAQQRDSGFLSWLTHTLVSPSTMVDSITPASDDALRDRVEATLGVRDRWPVQREAFTQWVVEADPRLPDIGWEAAGVTLSNDVAAHERAKLRVLNASHSALAYLGLLRGHETVADAMADPDLASFVHALMDDLGAGLTIDAGAYKQAVLKRFHNPAIRHLLSQIAWDGSQKLPNRVLPYIEEAAARGWPMENAARVIAGWFMFLRARSRHDVKLVDPLAPRLLQTAARANGDAAHDVTLFLALNTVFTADFAAQESIKSALIDAYRQLGH